MRRVSRLVLELHVPDFRPAEEFYGLLGFTEARREQNYLVLTRGEETLCFYGGSSRVAEHSYFSQYPTQTKRGYGVEIVIMVENLDEIYEHLSARYTIAAPIQTRPWGGVKDFRVEDPFGFYVRISEAYDPSGIEN